MVQTPAISVVIATRNYGRYLPGAISSVLSQTWTDLELIIIDDGSTDNTPAVVQPFLQDPRVYYHRTDGLGQSRAKNVGVQLSSATLIAFLDGDDEWLPTKLERQLPLFRDPEIGVVYSRRTLMNEAGDDFPTPEANLARGQLFNTLLIQNPICFSSVIVRRRVFEWVGLFDPRLQLAIDYDLWLRVARHFEFDFVDEPLVRYRTGHANLSKRIQERIATVLSILDRSLANPDNASLADPAAVASAYGSTYRTLAYVLRDERPFAASRWYFRAARRDGLWLESARAIAIALARKALI